MLEVFAYRKYKQRKKQKESQEGKTKEALSKQDEEFLRQSLNTKPMPGMKSIFKGLIQRKSAKSGRLTDDEPAATRDGGTPTSQEEDISSVLESLNLAADKKTAFSFSDETRKLLKEFIQILKDIQSGAPHAYDDLTSFLHRSNDKLNRIFDSIPGSLKSLISALPFPAARKLDKQSPKEAGLDVLKTLAKPGVATGLLKNIMNLLKTRFPAFIGTNLLLTMGVFVLLIGVWYCYKRGREERKKNEAVARQEILVPVGSVHPVEDHGDQMPDGETSLGHRITLRRTPSKD